MHVHEHSHAHHKLTGVLQWCVVVTMVLVVVELFAGWFSHSLALVSDGIHNLTDIPTLVVSWLAVRWADRPPTSKKTFGYHRAGILAAFTNALLLAVVAVFILWEAYQRLRQPVAVQQQVMLWIGALALLVNGGITLGLVSGRRDLNLRSVLIHNFGDALSNVAILLGALAIRWTGASWVDPALSLGIGVLVLWSSIGVLRESSHILLEGLPREMNLEEVARVILGISPVQEVHDVHIWTLGTERYILSCHVRIPDMHMEDSQKILERINECLAREFHISHTTIQFERAGLPASFYMPTPFDSSSK